jgi:class 3 adenylate cyclase
MEMADQTGNKALWANAASNHGWFQFMSGRMSEGITLMEEAWKVADELDLSFIAFVAAWTRAGASYSGGFDLKETRKWCDREAAKPRLSQAPNLVRTLAALSSQARVMQGEISDELIASMYASAQTGFNEAACAAYHDADFERCERLALERIRDSERRQAAFTTGGHLWFLAQSKLVLGEYDESIRLATQGLSLSENVGFGRAWGLWIALGHLLKGDPEAAAPHLDKALETLPLGEDIRGLAALSQKVTAMHAAATGETDLAWSSFAESVDVARRYALQWEEADANHMWGRALLDAGNLIGAIERFNAALDVYARIGAKPFWSERVVADKMRAQGLDASLSVATSIEAVTAAVRDDHVSLEPLAAKDGLIAIMFTDIEGSTAMAGELGDRAWFDLLRRHNESIREKVSKYGGVEVKSVGDGFMIAFEDLERALSCATAIQRAITSATPEIKVRIGVHAGQAIREGGDFFGTTVNLASRIADAASGGEILVSPSMTKIDCPFDEPREVALKGFTGTQKVHPLRWVASTA